MLIGNFPDAWVFPPYPSFKCWLCFHLLYTTLAHCSSSESGCVIMITNKPWEWMRLPKESELSQKKQGEYQRIRSECKVPMLLFQTILILQNEIICFFDNWYLLIFCYSSLSPSQTIFWCWTFLISSVLWVSVTWEQLCLCSSNWNTSMSIKVSSKPCLWLDISQDAHNTFTS